MKRLLLVFLLTLSQPASAVWVWVADATDTSYYIDPTTLNKQGLSRVVWELADYKKPSQYGNFSAISRWEYDCNANKKRLLTSAFFTGNMGTGSVITSHSKASEWDYHAPNSVGNVLLKLICAQ